LHPAVASAHHETDDVLNWALACGVVHDGRLAEQQHRGRWLLLGLPVLDDPFSVGEVCDNRQTELMERGVIAAQRIHECPRIVSCPRRIESDKQCGVHATCLVVGWIPYVSPEALLATFRAKFRRAYLP